MPWALNIKYLSIIYLLYHWRLHSVGILSPVLSAGRPAGFTCPRLYAFQFNAFKKKKNHWRHCEAYCVDFSRHQSVPLTVSWRIIHTHTHKCRFDHSGRAEFLHDWRVLYSELIFRNYLFIFCYWQRQFHFLVFPSKRCRAVMPLPRHVLLVRRFCSQAAVILTRLLDE